MSRPNRRGFRLLPNCRLRDVRLSCYYPVLDHPVGRHAVLPAGAGHVPLDGGFVLQAATARRGIGMIFVISRGHISLSSPDAAY
jgi:hypothetical protein